jgi:hypothetical protein
MVTTIAGIAIGDATNMPPAAAKPKPTLRNTLKNFGVGAFNLSISFISVLLF